MLQKRCLNDNHGRAVVTVRFCSHCGVVVNDRIRAHRCAAEAHAQMRRSQSIYCVDCGERLMAAR
jgi:ribosomal protein L37E